jgi:hypothetical protein
LRELSERTRWEIELPEALEDFFQEAGPMPSMPGDERRAVRLRVRTKSVMLSEVALPAIPRGTQPFGIYMSDISRYGAGFLAAEQFFPIEQVRLLLPTFWLSVRVVRARRLGPRCFHIGTELMKKHEPGVEAFQFEPQSYVAC